jgi:alkylation response protein AidB-like acyl-CoA dehydrogenase
MSATLLARLEPAGARLEGLLSGAARPVLAHNEAAARGDLGWVATTARPDGDGFVLEGEKTAILGGPAASSYLVSCRIPGEPDVALFEVQPGAAGLQVQDFRTVDNRGATNLRLAGVRVGAQARIGTAAQAAAALGAALDHGLVAACAETCGAMQAALKITREYLNTRKQFGVPIGDFQALRHKLADMFIETEQARSIVLRAIAAQNGSDAAEATRLASAAKARVGKAGHFVGAQAIQLHGGIGVTEEYSIGQYYKRFVMFDLWMGSSASHLDRFRRLGAEAA